MKSITNQQIARCLRWTCAIIALIVAFRAPSHNKLASCAMLSFCGVPVRKQDEYNEGQGGGGGMSATEFQGKVLENVGKIRTTQEQMAKDVSRLDTDTKKALEDLTKAKNDYAGLDSQVKSLELLIKKVQLQFMLEERMANGGNTLSLGQRVIRDKDKARNFFGHICRAIGRTDLAAKALGEDSSPGSTLINDELSAEMYDSLLKYGAWSTLGVRAVGTKNLKVPVKTARPSANVILTEGGSISDDSTKAGTSISLEMEVYAVLLNVSLQLIDDGEYDVVADVIDDFIEALNYRLDYTSFRGDGTEDATNGGVTGLFNFATASTATATRTSIGATKYDDWLKCLTAVDAVVLQRAARWWMHPTLMAAAIGVQDSNGRPIFQTALEAPAGGIMNLFGFPVTMVGAAPSTNAASAKVAVFGDPRAYAVGVRKQVVIEESDHARWTTLERSFRGYMRADAKGLKASALAAMTLPAS